MGERNHYKVLGVPPSASADEIKKAFRKLSNEFHPDRNPGDMNSVEMQKMINDAYRILSDPLTRRTFDQEHFSTINPPFPSPTSLVAPPLSLHVLLTSFWQMCTDAKPAWIAALLLSDVALSLVLSAYLRFVPQVKLDPVSKIVRDTISNFPGGEIGSGFDLLTRMWPDNYTGIGFLFLAFGGWICWKMLNRSKSDPIWAIYGLFKVIVLLFLFQVVLDLRSAHRPNFFLTTICVFLLMGLMILAFDFIRTRKNKFI